MAKYLVTGISGTGKSTIAHELQKRGLTAYDTDALPDVSYFADHTGRPATPPIDQRQFYHWNWDEQGLKALIAATPEVFICGATSNKEQFYPLFDSIFVLTIDEATLRQRLLTRTTNDFGKYPGELEKVISEYQDFERRLIDTGAIAVDATQPLERVLGEILAHTHHDSQ